MNIIYKKIGEIKPYDKNPRNNDKAVEAVANSIKEFGWQQPIVITEDGTIIIGHTRFKAAKLLEMDEVPCVIASDLTDEQIKALRLADNKVGELAEWDEALLNIELDEIIDLDMSDFGFLDEEIEEITEKEVEEDDFEEPEDLEPKAKLGDIYQLGRHRLMCGDSTNPTDIEKLIGGVQIDMIFTDPPYGYEYKSGYNNYEMLKNDDKILDFIPAVIPFLRDCAIYSFCGWQTIEKWIEYFKNTPLKLKNMIVWKKNNWSMGDLECAYAGQYEICLFLNYGKKELLGKRDTDIWEFDREPSKLHPTMKPIKMIGYALEKSSLKNENVLDLFGGSGSTLIACEQLDRNCFMMELDPHYVDVIIERWEKFTGQKAVLLN